MEIFFARSLACNCEISPQTASACADDTELKWCSLEKSVGEEKVEKSAFHGVFKKEVEWQTMIELWGSGNKGPSTWSF